MTKKSCLCVYSNFINKQAFFERHSKQKPFKLKGQAPLKDVASINQR